MELYTVREIAEILKFKEGTVRNMIHEKKIKTVKITGTTSIRITQEELDRLIGKIK